MWASVIIPSTSFFLVHCTVCGHLVPQGFPRSSVVKNPPTNAGDTRDMGSTPGSERPPQGGNGNPLLYSCLKNFTDRGVWWATWHRVIKSQTHDWARTQFPNPLEIESASPNHWTSRKFPTISLLVALCNVSQVHQFIVSKTDLYPSSKYPDNLWSIFSFLSTSSLRGLEDDQQWVTNSLCKEHLAPGRQCLHLDNRIYLKWQGDLGLTLHLSWVSGLFIVPDVSFLETTVFEREVGNKIGTEEFWFPQLQGTTSKLPQSNKYIHFLFST